MLLKHQLLILTRSRERAPNLNPCAPQSLDHTDGRPQMFVMRATRRRSDAHAETLADSIAGKLCRGGHDEADQVGE
jgi:hypothetical protein